MAGFADFVEETAWREGTDTLVVVTVVAAAWLRFRTRLPTEGFKDEEAGHLTTYAGTRSRLGQRIVVSGACTRGWPLVALDVKKAFLKGIT